MERKRVKMFLDWIGSLDEGSEAKRKNDKMRKSIAKELGLPDCSEIVFYCTIFCAGVEAAKKQN